jgi:hypothetical protein
MARKSLRRDITLILSIKVLIVLAAAFFVFGPRQRPDVDSDSTRDQLLGQFLPANGSPK